MWLEAEHSHPSIAPTKLVSRGKSSHSIILCITLIIRFCVILLRQKLFCSFCIKGCSMISIRFYYIWLYLRVHWPSLCNIHLLIISQEVMYWVKSSHGIILCITSIIKFCITSLSQNFLYFLYNIMLYVSAVLVYL